MNPKGMNQREIDRNSRPSNTGIMKNCCDRTLGKKEDKNLERDCGNELWEETVEINME